MREGSPEHRRRLGLHAEAVPNVMPKCRRRILGQRVAGRLSRRTDRRQAWLAGRGKRADARSHVVFGRVGPAVAPAEAVRGFTGPDVMTLDSIPMSQPAETMT
jgi:hypothetical protein